MAMDARGMRLLAALTLCALASPAAARAAAARPVSAARWRWRWRGAEAPDVPDVPDVRPAVSRRRYTSEAVERVVAELAPRLVEPLGALFANCWPNTLDTTAVEVSRGDAFVITGDIPALWLRDSTNQVLPFADLASEDGAIAALLEGLLRRQARSVLLDPYANAFNRNASTSTGQDHQGDVRTPPMQPAVFEGKWELDSLASFLRLGRAAWESNGGVPRGAFGSGSEWQRAVASVLDTLEEQQAGTVEEFGRESYLFLRGEGEAANGGRGAAAARCGLVKCAFRPSDDPTTFPFLVPANAYMSVELNHTSHMLDAVGNSALAARARRLGSEIRTALETHAVVSVPSTDGRIGEDERVFAYEVDGFGNRLLQDDANAPSLLALPLLGFVEQEDELYQATRRRALSRQNPFWFEGSALKGVGSPHTGPQRVWPLGLITQALTSDSDAEISQVLDQLVAAAAETGLMHESVSVTNTSDYTRSWFAWANGMFGTLIRKLAEERPWLVMRDMPAGVRMVGGDRASRSVGDIAK